MFTNTLSLRQVRTLGGLLVIGSAMGYSAPALAAVGTLADSSGEVVAWGDNATGQTIVPSGSFTAISAGGAFSLGIRSDGTLAGWGYNGSGQINVPYGDFIALSAGGIHGLAIRSDGTLAGWGYNGYGQATVPSGIFTAIAAGGYHSLGIKSDGTLAGWGDNGSGQATVPTGTFTAIAAGEDHSLGIRSDGTLAGWGYNGAGDINVPTGTFTSIAAGGFHSLAIKTDGTLAAWGDNNAGESTAPSGTFTAIAAGEEHSLGLKSDGTLAGWGSNSNGQTTVPTGIFTAIAAGGNTSLALRARTQYDGDLHITGSGLTANLNRSVTVAGNVLIDTPVNVYNSPVLDANGKITFASSNALSNVSISTPVTLASAGGIELTPGVTLTVPLGVQLSSSGPLIGSGVLNAGANSVSFGLTPQSKFNGGLGVAAGGAISFTGTGLVTPTSLSITGGKLSLGPGQTLQLNSTTNPLTNSGAILAIGNATAAAQFESRSALTNSASVGFINGQESTLSFTGGLSNAGALALTGGTNNVFGDINNTGNITVTGSANATFYDDIVHNGALTVRKAGTSIATAVFLGGFSGAGSITGGGNVIFEGDLRPGNSPAHVHYNADVAFGTNSSLNIELAGTADGQFDRVSVGGDLSLDGSLDVTLYGGFTPTAGDSFDILDWNTLAGSFSQINLPVLPNNLNWDASQLYSTGVLSVVPEPASLSLAALGLAGLLARRRTRQETSR